IEVVLSRIARINLGGLRVRLDRVIHLAGLGVSFGQIVVVSGQVLGRVGVFVIGSTLFDVNGFLIRFHGRVQTLLLLGRIGLLGRRHAVIVAELEPDQVTGRVHLSGLVHGRNGGFVVAGVRGGLGRVQFVV